MLKGTDEEASKEPVPVGKPDAELDPEVTMWVGLQMSVGGKETQQTEQCDLATPSTQVVLRDIMNQSSEPMPHAPVAWCPCHGGDA